MWLFLLSMEIKRQVTLFCNCWNYFKKIETPTEFFARWEVLSFKINPECKFFHLLLVLPFPNHSSFSSGCQNPHQSRGGKQRPAGNRRNCWVNSFQGCQPFLLTFTAYFSDQMQRVHSMWFHWCKVEKQMHSSMELEARVVVTLEGLQGSMSRVR